MELRAYNAKRDFTKTAEPEGKAGRSKASALKFVVQKHDASRLHYDFRLEFDGVLKSWAVPKGPSLDPAKKSLAVQVEDHPLDYGDFEGTIPEGEYGGGTVMLWDRGTWEPLHDPAEGLESGKLHFVIHGEKLAGEWAIVQMHGRAGDDGKNWLLMKVKDKAVSKRDVLTQDQSIKTGRSMDEIAEGDEVWHSNGSGKKAKNGAHAAIHKLPKNFSPQLAVLAEKPPTGDEWVHEIKFDGYRILVHVQNKRVTLFTRNGHDWTHKFSTIAKACARLKVSAGIFDGEVVVLDKDGRSDFQALQAMLKHKEKVEPVLYLFDLPHVDGEDLTQTPLIERKKRLAKILRASKIGGRVEYSDHTQGDASAVLKQACGMSLEGIISKRADSHYVSRREATWLKSKCQERQEFVIIGYTDAQGGRKHFGSLVIGVHDDKKRLVYAGRVGTGFDDRLLGDLMKQLKELARKSSPTDVPVPARERLHAHWVEPSLVGEVRFTGWTRDGVLRHPAFMGLRADKPASHVVSERPAAAKPEAPADASAGVKLTHPDKVLYPETGTTKQDLANYYQRVAERMLPHVIDRPLALVRCPNGRAGKCFFQRNYTDALPDAMVGINVGEGRKKDLHVSITDVAGLVSLVQIGVLEIHTWGCRKPDIEHPDQLIFDLDPDEVVAWREVKRAAKTLKQQLDALKLPSFLKTSGGKGLHIVIPIKPTIDWDTAKSFCETIVKSMADAEPDRFVANMRKDLRKGKIYIDYHRNGRGATAVAPYSSRARTDAPVSMPINWEDLSRLKSAAQFTVASAARQLKKRDPWRDFDSSRVDLRKAVGDAH